MLHYDYQKASKDGAALLHTWQQKLWKKKLLRIVLYTAVILGALAGMLYGYYRLYQKVPSHMVFFQDQEQHLTLGVPMTGEVVPAGMQPTEKLDQGVLNLMGDNLLHMEENTLYRMKVRLFGIFPVKEVEMKLIEQPYLQSVGYPIGIYIDMKGLLVVGIGDFENEQGQSVCPSKNLLEVGDYLLDADNIPLKNKEDLVSLVENGNGEPVRLRIERNGKIRLVDIRPQKNEDHTYKLGIWLRDDTQGIGTMTYLKDNGDYAALGHGINDVDSGVLMHLEDGSIYRTEIIRKAKGKPGTPGQMTGMIVYHEDQILGSLDINSSKGIYGSLNEAGETYILEQTKDSPLYNRRLPIGLKQNISLGKARILSTIETSPEYFEVEITAIHLDRNQSYREIEFRVTDERLLEKTGGIIQGMSGSPILQNDCIIGAVTHVFVNDPTRGYGIFIESMLET